MNSLPRFLCSKTGGTLCPPGVCGCKQGKASTCAVLPVSPPKILSRLVPVLGDSPNTHSVSGPRTKRVLFRVHSTTGSPSNRNALEERRIAIAYVLLRREIGTQIHSHRRSNT